VGRGPPVRDQEATWFQEQVRDLDRPAAGDEGRLEKVRDIANLCRLRVERHDPYTKEHSVRVAAWSKVIARRLPTFDRERLARLEITALVHDYGKIDVPADILNKNGRLTPAEFKEVMRHPTVGAARLETFAEHINIDGVLYHHVRYDGGGYPVGSARQAGSRIPLEARIIAVGDTFDALTSDRAYRRGLEPARALQVMRGVAGKQLDPTLLRVFESYHALESAIKGYDVGAQTMVLAATVDDEIRHAKDFLRREVGEYDRLNPLGKVRDREAFVQRAIEHLVSLSVNRDMAEKFVRHAYRLPLRETFDRDDIALTDGELAVLISADEEAGRRGHREVALPLRRMTAEYAALEIAVFNHKLWKCTGDGNTMLLFR
jgi:hypothetical protein